MPKTQAPESLQAEFVAMTDHERKLALADLEFRVRALERAATPAPAAPKPKAKTTTEPTAKA